MLRSQFYEGIDKVEAGGMDATGNIIRDAWVFDIIPETETCEGWNVQRIDGLYDQVTKAWEPYGHMVSNLPPEIREKHQRIYEAAIRNAKEKGWDPELDDND